MWSWPRFESLALFCDIHGMHIPEMPVGADFYERLQEALSDAGLGTTQVEIAALLEVSQGSVSKWKNSLAYPSRAVAAKAAEITRVALPWLYFGIGNKRAASDMDELTWALMLAFEQLSEDQKRELVDYARFKAHNAAPPATEGGENHNH